MKKVWPAWLFLFLGAFFLTTAGVAQFWAKDAAERTPLDSYQVTLLTGTAHLLDPATGKTSTTPVKIANITQVDGGLSTGNVIAFVTSTCVNKDVGDPPNCLPKSDARMISDTKLNYAADRHTAEAIDHLRGPRQHAAGRGPDQQVAVPQQGAELRRLGRHQQAGDVRRVRRHHLGRRPEVQPVPPGHHQHTDRPRQRHPGHLQPGRDLHDRPAHREDHQPADPRRPDAQGRRRNRARPDRAVHRRHDQEQRRLRQVGRQAADPGHPGAADRRTRRRAAVPGRRGPAPDAPSQGRRRGPRAGAGARHHLNPDRPEGRRVRVKRALLRRSRSRA